MDMSKVPNLDVQGAAREFTEAYGTLKGRALANRIGLTGPGSATLATALSCYAWNARTAQECRLRGDVRTALTYEGICDRIYTRDIQKYGIW